MTTSDVPEVAHIETAAFSTPWSERTFRSLLHRSGVELWVAEWGDQLAAYAILWKVLDEGELANIAVRKDLRGRGIGSGLLSRILEVAEDSGFEASTSRFENPMGSLGRCMLGAGSMRLACGRATTRGLVRTLGCSRRALKVPEKARRWTSEAGFRGRE